MSKSEQEIPSVSEENNSELRDENIRDISLLSDGKSIQEFETAGLLDTSYEKKTRVKNEKAATRDFKNGPKCGVPVNHRHRCHIDSVVGAVAWHRTKRTVLVGPVGVDSLCNEVILKFFDKANEYKLKKMKVLNPPHFCVIELYFSDENEAKKCVSDLEGVLLGDWVLQAETLASVQERTFVRPAIYGFLDPNLFSHPDVSYLLNLNRAYAFDRLSVHWAYIERFPENAQVKDIINAFPMASRAILEEPNPTSSSWSSGYLMFWTQEARDALVAQALKDGGFTVKGWKNKVLVSSVVRGPVRTFSHFRSLRRPLSQRVIDCRGPGCSFIPNPPGTMALARLGNRRSLPSSSAGSVNVSPSNKRGRFTGQSLHRNVPLLSKKLVPYRG